MKKNKCKECSNYTEDIINGKYNCILKKEHFYKCLSDKCDNFTEKKEK